MSEDVLPPDVETLIAAPTRDLGDGFRVRRALPSAKRRLVGPFIFLDQMGPMVFSPGRGLDVRPHPHIGLATVTYLFEGRILHRDSLGTVQAIEPGAVNWMTAGRGIAHSERTAPADRAAGSPLSGLQMWVALPRDHEQRSPSFVHHAAADLPVLDDGELHVRVIAGAIYGARSPVVTASETFYADATLQPGARLPLPDGQEERAFYVVDGQVRLDPDEGGRFGPGELVVVRPGAQVAIHAEQGAHVMLLGGATLDGERHIRWNFVSSSLDQIREAAFAWEDRTFAQVPGDDEFIPLPDDLRRPAAYP